MYKRGVTRIFNAISKFFNLTVKTKVMIIVITIIAIAIVSVVTIIANQIQTQTDHSIKERLQANATITLSVLETVKLYTLWMLDFVVESTYYDLRDGTDMHGELSRLLNSMNYIEDGIMGYENIVVLDRDLNIISLANPLGDCIDLAEFSDSFNEIRTQPWISPALQNPTSGNMQVVFTQPIMDGTELLAIAAIVANTESLEFFLADVMQLYAGHVNVADDSGIFFFSNRPAYIGRHIDDMGIYDALEETPKNIVFPHTSAVTQIDKVIYIATDPSWDWTIVSFFDAADVENTALIIFSTLAPTVLGIAIAAIFVVLVVHRSLKPLQGLADNAKMLARGNVAIKLKVGKNDEIGQVSDSFLEIVTALNILGSNFKNAEKSMLRGDTEYSLSDSRMGGIFDEMLNSANNIIKNIQSSMLKAQLASKAKSDFLAAMSHEIRTPMNAILGITQIQLQKTGLVNEEYAAFQKIYASGSTLLGIINDILDLSKIEMGKLVLNPVEYDTASFINDTIQLNVVRIGSKSIKFILEPDENLPKTLLGDELRIKQILNNLLSNAIKYTEEGYVKLTIKALPADDGAKLQFIVEDTGQGMKPEDLNTLFNAYVRFNMDRNRTVEGAGIGLTITDNLIKMMDGTIDVQSEFGKGSIFTVTIKQQLVDSTPIGKELAEQLGNFSFLKDTEKAHYMACEPMPYGRILVVDDVEINLYVTEGLLAPYQVTVETAISGFAALEKVGGGKTYDIIFMDHMMPQMDGIEATQKLREQGYAGAIIALTANALVGNDEMFMARGFDGFISKPIDIRILDAVMTRFVRDMHPEEAAKYKGAAVAQPISAQVQINPKLIGAFLRDAKGAVATIQQTVANGDIKLFTTTVHAMKSALANIGEQEAAEMADALEKAGHNNDMAHITTNAGAFVAMLESIMARRDRRKRERKGDGETTEDRAFLAEQMRLLAAACENYDDTAAYAAISRLKERTWTQRISDAIEEIHNTLMLRSDFEKAAELAGRFANN